MKDKVAKHIAKPPLFLQIAKDDVWENTWNIDLSQPKPSTQKITDYLRKKEFKKVAIELLFQEAEQKTYILGLVFNNHILIKNPQDFLMAIIDEAYNYQNFSNLITKLDQRIIGKSYLLRGSPEIIRIGIVNHWFSVGPALIWQNGCKKEISDSILNQRLLTKPEIVKTRLNYLGLAFIYNVQKKKPGLRHWMKAPCSRYKRGQWVLDREMTYYFLKQWQNFSLS